MVQAMTHLIHNLRHPEMRILLLDSLLDLGDKPYQLENWASKTAAHKFWDAMRFPIEHLFDVLNLEEIPEDQIGYSLYNKRELDSVLLVINALNQVIDAVGRKQPDEYYINSPLWDNVVKTSQHAFKLLMKKETMTEEHKEHWNSLRRAFYKQPLPLLDLANKWDDSVRPTDGLP